MTYSLNMLSVILSNHQLYLRIQRLQLFWKFFRSSSMIPVFMSIKNMGYLILREITLQIIHNNCRICRVYKNQWFLGSSWYDVGVVILEERKCDNFVIFFKGLHSDMIINEWNQQHINYQWLSPFWACWISW